MISFKPPMQLGGIIRSFEIFVISLNPSAQKSINISAMSDGSLSKNAVLALSMGAKKGGFYHNTDEGGDLVWQLGTAYFGARDSSEKFNLEKFQRKIADHPQVKMIEIKLSKGAKPGYGGSLTREIHCAVA